MGAGCSKYVTGEGGGWEKDVAEASGRKQPSQQAANGANGSGHVKESGVVGGVGDIGSGAEMDGQDDASESDGDDIVEAEMKAPSEKYLKGRGRQSVSAEVYGEWNKKELFVPPVYSKESGTKDRIRAKLEQSFLFSNLDEKDMAIVIDAFAECNHPSAGELVIRQGDDGDKLYLIETGSVNVTKIIDDEEKFLTKMTEGEAFGELALMYNAPRAATVKTAVDDCRLWSLDRNTFNHIVKDAAKRKRELYENILNDVPLLGEIDAYERSKVADALKEQSYGAGEIIIKEGDAGDTFYMLIAGTAEAIKEGQTVMTYKKGDYFGELALIRKQPRAATVHAVEPCKTVYLDRKSFQRLLGPIEETLKRNMDSYRRVMENLGLDTNYLQS